MGKKENEGTCDYEVIGEEVLCSRTNKICIKEGCQEFMPYINEPEET